MTAIRRDRVAVPSEGSAAPGPTSGSDEGGRCDEPSVLWWVIRRSSGAEAEKWNGLEARMSR